MTVDWSHFTPWASLAGGILIGIAAAMLVLLNGRVAGISGIVGGLLAPRRGEIAWRLAFLGGLLLAPAVMFAKDGHHLLPPERIEEWRRRGAIPFFHYGYNEERPLDFAFYEDTLRYDAFEAMFSQPTLIFQGVRDTSVDHRTVERFARTRPNVTLSLLDDDHQLTESLPRIWNDVEAFLGLIE